MQNSQKTVMPFLAGLGSSGEPVFESLEVEVMLENPDLIRLMKSPLLTRSLAAGDTLKVLNAQTAEYQVVSRSGNLCLRVFDATEQMEMEQSLTSSIEKLGGSLDLQTERALVYSIHVSIGFQTIEKLFNKACGDNPDTVWYYGNVYDPEDGVTPLEWWLDFDPQN